MELVHIAVWQQRRFRMLRIIFHMAENYFMANIWLVVCLVKVDLVVHISVWIDAFLIAVAIKEYFPNGLVWRKCDKTRSSYQVTPYTRNPKCYSNVARTIFSKKPECCHSLAHRKALSVHAVFLKKMTVYIWLWIMCVETADFPVKRNNHFTDKIVGIYCTIRSGHCWTPSERGLVHQDVSPDNVIINAEGNGVLIDFGAVRHANAIDDKTRTSIYKQDRKRARTRN